MPETIVIADDVTGANDIGIMYAKAGLKTLVYSYGDGSRTDYEDCDVLVIDTDSRFDTQKEAYRKVFEAVKTAPKEHVKQYIDKQCSVFRGNIGAEFDAMLDALGEDFAVVVPGFPDNGRTTVHGVHYVYGVKLEDSQFQNDPVHPMTCSSLAEILAGQTKRRVGSVWHEAYEEGVLGIRRAVDEAKKSCNYCIMDVRGNEDLALLAEALGTERVICGSSALSAWLAGQKTAKMGNICPKRRESGPGRIFCAAGSLTPQTAEQTEWMRERGYPVITLDTARLFDEREKERECARVLREVEKAYEAGRFAMVHTMNTKEEIARTKRKADSAGYSNTEVSSFISEVLSEISRQVIERFAIRTIIVCGGDTSASLCSALGIRGMRVLEEIEPGLPTCESAEAPHYRLVLKSGSFGSREFLEKAMEKEGFFG